jgi:hypothetical protein
VIYIADSRSQIGLHSKTLLQNERRMEGGREEGKKEGRKEGRTSHTVVWLNIYKHRDASHCSLVCLNSYTQFVSCFIYLTHKGLVRVIP